MGLRGDGTLDEQLDRGGVGRGGRVGAGRRDGERRDRPHVLARETQR